MKTFLAILILAAVPLAAQDEASFKGTIAGMGVPEPAAYVPDESLGYMGGIILDTTAKPVPPPLVLYVPVPVAVDQPVILGGGLYLGGGRPIARRAAVRVAARRR
jgi:hypothetical protein